MLLPSFLSHGVEHCLLSDDAPDEGAHVFDGVALEMVDEILVHEATRQFGEQLQMGVAATLGDKDVDDRVDGSVVERVPLDGRGQAREENGGGTDVGALGMWDSHAVAKARRSLGLALMKVGDDSGRIGGDAQLHGLRGEGLEDGVLVGGVDGIECVRRI